MRNTAAANSRLTLIILSNEVGNARQRSRLPLGLNPRTLSTAQILRTILRMVIRKMNGRDSRHSSVRPRTMRMKGMRREEVVENVELMTRSMTQKNPGARFLMNGSERRQVVADPSSNGL